METGDRLGPYEIVSRIGAGGMGEVFKARDARLNRSVAIKILPSEYAPDTHLRTRFEREARTISQLNHPRICTIHDVGESGGNPYLVMELLEGETLADRINRGPLPLRDVLRYGAEIAEALDAAHRAGIVHRDLKPGNVMITRTGAKLLDFGLAKPSPVEADDAGLTAQKPLTREGTLVGTFQYMAPEQLDGSATDPRTDIFALGALLYEMATGRRAFEGKTRASLIAAIVSGTPPPIRDLQPLAPAGLEHLVAKCLEKDPEDRWQSAHDIAEELRWIAEQSLAGTPAPAIAKRKPKLVVAGLALLILLAAAAVVSSRWLRSGATATRVSVVVSPLRLAGGLSTPDFAISSDGRHLVFAVIGEEGLKLYSRTLDTFLATPIAGTDRATMPFFSPDDEWIGFFAPGSLKKVRSSGGAVETITTGVRGAPRGAAWAADGTIYFATFFGGIWKIRPGDSAPVEITKPNTTAGENSHRWPHVLPDGRHLLFTIRTDRLTTFDDAQIAILDLETDRWETIVRGGTSPAYLPSGHLVYARDGTLYAAELDVAAAKVVSQPVIVARDVVTGPSSGAAHYAVARRAGAMVFLPGGPAVASTRLERFDRQGQQTVSATIEHRINTFDVSPDEKYLALHVQSANDDIWLYDIERGITSRFSFEPGDEGAPLWTPDGTSLVFGSARGILRQRADGSDAAVLLASAFAFPNSISPDGKTLLATMRDERNGLDLAIVSLMDEQGLRPFLQTPFDEMAAAFSPDGNWVAYVSNESGSYEVYVRRTDGGGKAQVSLAGGGPPRWSRNGREIYYWKSGELIAVPVALTSDARIGKPEPVATVKNAFWYDVLGDGFLVAVVPEPEHGTAELRLALGWVDEVSRRLRE
ncbi:MAG TPA: protein kinase [Thermoanaerobaculia bacterium]|nr:protein kinase [Thermoanaerobaculia bacterium]